MTRREFRESLELRGLSVDRPVQTGMVWGPRAEGLRDGSLVYDLREKNKRAAGTGLLIVFLELCEATDDAIYSFAKKWAVLGLCAHGLPCHHRLCAPCPAQKTRPDERYRRLESTESWRRFARCFQSLLQIGAAISGDKPGGKEDWLLADEILSGPDFPRWDAEPWDSSMDLARIYLQALLRRLIEISAINVRFWSNDRTDRWQFDLDAQGISNLPGILTIQLLLAIAQADGFAVCSSCHRAYVPPRRPDPTRRNYCDKCGIRAAWRDAARQRRKKLREEKDNGKKTRPKRR